MYLENKKARVVVKVNNNTQNVKLCTHYINGHHEQDYSPTKPHDMQI